MFKNKATNGKNNLCSENIRKFRKGLNLSQNKLANRLQLVGLNIDKNAIQRIEAGKRFVTDIEIVKLAKVLQISINQLLE